MALLLLVSVPVVAAPSLQKGDRAVYSLSASISFLQYCGPIGVPASSNMIVCPMIATMPLTVDFNGTLAWAATDLNSTTASLNITRDLAISNDDASGSLTHTVVSFNESIDLATRIVSLLPLIMPEMDQAIKMAQNAMGNSLPSSVNWSSSMSMLDNTIVHRPLYTMWWVNGPLKGNQTVPVLVLPTNVTGTSNVDLGGTLGTRTAWTLAFNLSQPLVPPDPLATSPSSIPFGDNLEIAFTFNYDQTTDLLLSASADIHLGLGVETIIEPIACDSSITSNSCPATPDQMMIMRGFGLEAHATLKLASTTVDLAHRIAQTGSSQNGNEGSHSGTGSGSGTGTGSGPGAGSGSNPGTGTGDDSSSTTGATPSGTGQPTGNQAQPKSTSAGWSPWIYGLLGIVAVAITGTGVWTARKRMKKIGSKTSAAQPSV